MKRTTLVQLVVFPLFIAVIVYLFFHVYIENFQIGTRFDCPTRNQSYDLRQDIVIPRNEMPWNNSSIGATHPEECLFKKSII
jgi:hypothetical protein